MTQKEMATAIRVAAAEENVRVNSRTDVLERRGKAIDADIVGLIILGALGAEKALTVVAAYRNAGIHDSWLLQRVIAVHLNSDPDLFQHLDNLSLDKGLSHTQIAEILEKDIEVPAEL